jgi:23S rRNA pseudouridine2605 synthase
VRLNQYLARAGFGSRRACEALILEGRVTLNGKRVAQLATQVGPKDSVSVNHKKVQGQTSLIAVLYKPRGFVCSTTGRDGEKTIYELLPRGWPRVFYVGRLDKDSEGLLLLTNDGALSQKLSHPKNKVPKTYEVLLDREFDLEKSGPALIKGFTIESGFGKFESVFKLGPRHIKVVLTQGLKRQIRLMLYKMGYEVNRLTRTRIGNLGLGDLKPGETKVLNEKEIQSLMGRTVQRNAGKPAAKV